MRLWHIDLIPYLPKSQLVAQKRECDLIWKDYNCGIQTKHILINYIHKYYVAELLEYYYLLMIEFENRGYKFKNNSPFELKEMWFKPFEKHHNKEYLTICYWNLREKYIRGQKDFTDNVWQKLDEFYKNRIGEE